MKRFMILILAGALNVAAFQNCSSQGDSSTAPTTANTATATLVVSATSYSIVQYQSQQIVTTGGTAPYTYSLTSGPGTVDASTGWYTASGTIGTAAIQVKDANGALGTIAISVTAGSSTGTTTTYDCSDVVPVTVNQNCWNSNRNGTCTVNVSYYSSIPTGCKVATVTAYVGFFAGSPGACSAQTTLSVSGSGSQSISNNSSKNVTIAVTNNASAKTLSISNTTSGWKEPGYFDKDVPSNPCLSGISLELTLQSI